METNSPLSSPFLQPYSTDWDQPLTDLDLEALDAAFLCQTETCRKSDGGSHEERRPKTRRRLPASLFTPPHRLKHAGEFSSECSLMSVSNSSSLLPCPRNRASNHIYHSPCPDKLKMSYPALIFKGRIVYSRTVFEVEKAANELLKFVETKKRDGGRAILGFDIEWRPTFRKGAKTGKAAVMQICAERGHCHVMHVFHSGFPQNLQALLGDPTSVKVGVGIANDAHKVFTDHNVSVEALEDLSCLAKQKLGGEPKGWGLSSLTERLISRQIPKPSRIRLGNWEAAPLSKAQLEYAATDAYASWYLYEVLNRFSDADAVGNKTEEVEKGACSAATDAYASRYLYEVLNRFPDADAAGNKTEEVEKVACS